MPGPILTDAGDGSPFARMLAAARAAVADTGGEPVYAAIVVHLADGVPDAVVPLPGGPLPLTAGPASSAEDLEPAVRAFVAAYYPAEDFSASVVVRRGGQVDAVLPVVTADVTARVGRRVEKLLAAARKGGRPPAA